MTRSAGARQTTLLEAAVIVELKTLTGRSVAQGRSHGRQASSSRRLADLSTVRADVRKVLTNPPDGEAIYAKMVNALGCSVEAAVRLGRGAGDPHAARPWICRMRHARDPQRPIDILDPYVGYRVAHLMRRPVLATVRLGSWTSSGCCLRAMSWGPCMAAQPCLAS